MSIVIAFAPHPDDETLGAGGTLLKHLAAGDDVHWVIATDMTEKAGYGEDAIARRNTVIETVSQAYGFTAIHRLGFDAGMLDLQPTGDLIAAVGNIVSETKADTVYLPFPGDAHSDHRLVFDAANACTQVFRYPSIRSVLCYETLSETDAALRPGGPVFQPNLFVNIEPHLDEKIRIMSLYKGEMGAFPFPRSDRALRAQAELRGTQAGCHAAEAFMLLKEIRQ